MIKNFLNEVDGLNLLDIGSSGNLDRKWKPLNPYINLIGFDPNEEECKRMMNLPHNFKSVKYLPFAIAGEEAISTLYKTKSIYCYSLLEPNTSWLERFAFADLFERIGEEKISTRILSNIEYVSDMDVDVLKMDTQGLELPILENSGDVLDKAFLVETETGFVNNYLGETTYAQIDSFMRENGFLLFDINTSHRIPRNNVFKKIKTGAEQLLWCEAVWLKDYVALAKGNSPFEEFGREKVLKALILCSLQGCIDYGLEVAKLAYDMSILSQNELQALELKSGWILDDSSTTNKSAKFSVDKLINYGLRLLPIKVRRRIKEQAERAVHQRHLFRF